MVSTNDVQTKALYQKLTARGVGRVFYSFTVLQGLAEDPACPEQMRVRVREAAEALREFLGEIPAETGRAGEAQMLFDAIDQNMARVGL